MLLLVDVVDFAIKKAFYYFCLENEPTAIDSSVSTTIKKAKVISLTKNFIENEKTWKLK